MSDYEGTHICLNCGNTKRFRMIRDWQLEATTEDVWDCERQDFVEEGSPADNIEDEQMIDERDLECDECGSSSIDTDVDEEDIMEIKVLHTNKDGEWSREELEEDEQNEDIKAKYAEMKL